MAKQLKYPVLEIKLSLNLKINMFSMLTFQPLSKEKAIYRFLGNSYE